MQRSIRSDVGVVSALDPIVVNNDTEGTGLVVDLRGYGAALVIFHIGVSGDTLSGAVKLTLRVVESDDGAIFDDVDAADLDGVQGRVIDDPAEDAIVHAVAYTGSKRYLSVVVDTTGTHTNGTPCSAVVVRGLPAYAPVP
jgi:hypothetical protein